MYKFDEEEGIDIHQNEIKGEEGARERVTTEVKARRYFNILDKVR